MSDVQWKALRHGPLKELSPRVWRVQGDLPGMGLKRVMTVAKRDDGDLVLHSAMALDDEGMKAIEGLGRVAWVLVPNGYHRLDAPRFAARYPDAKILCPPGARVKVEAKSRVDGTYADMKADGAVSLEVLDGVAGQEGAMTVRDEDGATLVLNDVLFNCPHLPGLEGFVFRHITRSTGGPRVSRVFRWFVMKDARALAAHLRRLADTPDLRRVIVSHQDMITDDPAGTLRAVADTL